jgi:surface protein
MHYCCTEYGSSGSPILNLLNNKIIGIHKERVKNKNFNRGTLLKYPIIEFLTKYSNKNESKNALNILNNKEYFNEDGFFNKEFGINFAEDYSNNNKQSSEETIKKDNIGKKNKINLTLKVEKYDIGQNIYFLIKDKNYIDNYNKVYNYCIKYYNKLLNESNIEIFINNIKYENKKYFRPKETGEYKIKLIFNTNITTTSYMFYECTNLINIDLSSLDTKNVSNMSNMFDGCLELTNVDLSSFDIRNVYDLSYMFHSCSKLTNLDLSYFDTKNVKNMSFMFYECSKLTKIDLSSFDIKNVNDMSGIFARCSNLRIVKINNIISNVKLKEELISRNINIIDKFGRNIAT